MRSVIKFPINTSIQNIRPSATLAINERSSQLIAQGKRVFRLGFGQSPFPVPKEVVASLQEHASVKDYQPVQGLLALREAVAEFNIRTLGIDCSAPQILIGPGSKELIFNLQMALDADLILPSPSWVSYEPQAQLLSKKFHWLSTSSENGWRLTAEDLNAFCMVHPERSKILILNYPNNPAGTTYSAKQLKALASVARQHKIIIVADEIYGEMHHDGQHISIANYYQEGTIISSGLSKWCGAGGWRLGTFTFPKGMEYLCQIMCTIASETYTSVSAPIQYAAVTAFKGSQSIEKYVMYSRIILKAVALYVHTELSRLNIEMPLPEGGFYLFVNFEKHRTYLKKKDVIDSPSLCEKLLQETGIALLPGVAFGRPSRELTARLSFVDFDGGKLLDIIEQDPEQSLNHKFIKTNCPNITDAIVELELWLKR